MESGLVTVEFPLLWTARAFLFGVNCSTYGSHGRSGFRLLAFELLNEWQNEVGHTIWTNLDKMCLFFENFGFLGNPDNYTSKTTQSCGTSSPGIETIGTRRCFTRRIGQQKSFVRCEKTPTLSRKCFKIENRFFLNAFSKTVFFFKNHVPPPPKKK